MDDLLTTETLNYLPRINLELLDTLKQLGSLAATKMTIKNTREARLKNIQGEKGFCHNMLLSTLIL